MDEREHLAAEVASRYYIENEGMSELAQSLGVSRSTISRLISLARERGWVQIEVKHPDDLEPQSVRFLRETFGLASVVAVLSRPTIDVADAVGRRAAEILTMDVDDNQKIGIAWGTTTASIASHLTSTARAGCYAVQLNGAGSSVDFELDYAIHIIGQFCQSWNAKAVLFPVPAFFDDPNTRTAMWKERSVKQVRMMQRACDIAVFSVGSTRADRPSRVHSGGYLNRLDRSQLAAEGAIGDIATYFYDSNGRTDGIELNRRASGLPLDRLRAIKTKYCVVSGLGKADALAGALRGGYVDHLIADSELLLAVAEICRLDGRR